MEKVQFITHYTERYSYLDSARMALEGGCRWIQLRMKDTPVDEVEREAIRLQGLWQRLWSDIYHRRPRGVS